MLSIWILCALFGRSVHAVDLYLSAAAPPGTPNCGIDPDRPCRSLDECKGRISSNTSLWFDATVSNPVYFLPLGVTYCPDVPSGSGYCQVSSWAPAGAASPDGGARLDFSQGSFYHGPTDVAAVLVLYRGVTITNKTRGGQMAALFLFQSRGSLRVVIDACLFLDHSDLVILDSSSSLTISNSVFARSSIVAGRPLVRAENAVLYPTRLGALTVVNCWFSGLLTANPTFASPAAVILVDSPFASVSVINCTYSDSSASLFVGVRARSALFHSCTFYNLVVYMDVLSFRMVTSVALRDSSFRAVQTVSNADRNASLVLITREVQLRDRLFFQTVTLDRVAFTNCRAEALLRWNFQQGFFNMSRSVVQNNSLLGKASLLFLSPPPSALLRFDINGLPVFNDTFSCEISSSVFRDNMAGCLSASSGLIAVRSSAFEHNVASGIGAAASLEGSARVSFSRCVLINNNAPLAGATVYSASAAALVFSRSIIAFARADPTERSPPSVFELVQTGYYSLGIPGAESKFCCPPGHVMVILDRLASTTRNCPQGSRQACMATTMRMSCQACLVGSYSLGRDCLVNSSIPTAVQCASCPLGAVCNGADDIQAQRGYWGTRVRDALACRLCSPFAVLTGRAIGDDAVSRRLLRRVPSDSRLLRARPRRAPLRLVPPSTQPDALLHDLRP
jgi:hypothetical protein